MVRVKNYENVFKLVKVVQRQL